MRFASFSVLALLSLASSVISSPGSDKACGCLNKHDVSELTEAYKRLVNIGEFRVEDAEKYLADDWVDISQSINTFTGQPFDGITFNKTSFIQNQSNSQLPPSPIVLQSDPIVTCNQIVLIWSTTFGAGRPVRGISVIKLGRKGRQWEMKQWDVEFNSLNWAYNLNAYYCLFGKAFGNIGACSPATTP